MWYFFSPVGTFVITLESDGTISLWIDTEKLAVLSSPDDAVDAVKSRKTGHTPWDDLADGKAPDTLDEWMMMPGTMW